VIFTGNKNFVCKINVFQGFFVPNITIYTKKTHVQTNTESVQWSLLRTGRTNCTQVFIVISIIFWFVSS